MSERNAVGTWKEVGYVAPGATKSGDDGTTTNFTYAQGTLTSSALANDSKELGITWGAINNVALNDCAVPQGKAVTNANWTIKLWNTSNGNSILYEAAVGDDNCKQLTPSFELISSKK